MVTPQGLSDRGERRGNLLLLSVSFPYGHVFSTSITYRPVGFSGASGTCGAIGLVVVFTVFGFFAHGRADFVSNFSHYC